MAKTSPDRQVASRTYHSVLRAEQADRTRQLIAEAASARFLEDGWAGTSVRSVAAAAGVSEATVYAVYGNKAGLARSLVDSVDQPANIPGLIAAINKADGDPAGQLAAYTAFDRRLFEHGGPVLRVLAEARRQEPDLAAAYAEGRGRGDSGRRQLFERWPGGVWRDGVTPKRALDVYAVLISIETYDVATRERGWSPARVERWWHETLVQQLLA
jgi:AcrR family transcriptional regulator